MSGERRRGAWSLETLLMLAMLQDIKHKQHELISRYYLGEDEFVQLHLRDRERKAECACFF